MFTCTVIVLFLIYFLVELIKRFVEKKKERKSSANAARLNLTSAKKRGGKF